MQLYANSTSGTRGRMKKGARETRDTRNICQLTAVAQWAHAGAEQQKSAL